MTVASFIKLSGSKVQRAQQGSPQVIEAGQLVLFSDCQLGELEECFITSHMSCKPGLPQALIMESFVPMKEPFGPQTRWCEPLGVVAVRSHR